MAEQKNIVSNESNSYLDLILLAMTLVFKDVSQVSLKQAEVINLLHTAATELKNNPDLKINAFISFGVALAYALAETTSGKCRSSAMVVSSAVTINRITL